MNVLGAGQADVYVPGQDPAPTSGWPRNLDEIAAKLSHGTGEGDEGGGL